MNIKEAIKTLFEEAGSIPTTCENCLHNNTYEKLGCYVLYSSGICEWKPSNAYIDTLIDSIVKIVEASNDN